MDSPVVEVSGLGKQYRGGLRGKSVDALVDFNLRVSQGEVFGLLGPNGAGKTTFIKVLLGIVHPTSGSGTMLGRPLGDHRARLRVGYLPEQHRFPTHLTARQALDLYGRLAGLESHRRANDAQRLLAQVNLSEWADVKVGKFSKGMMQRLGLAQALMGSPELVVLDEPTDGVDPIGRREIREIVSWLRDAGTTVFVNSHLLSEVEMVCTRAAILDKGRLVGEGSIADLTAAPSRYEVIGSATNGPLPAGVSVLRENEAWPQYEIAASSPEDLTQKLSELIGNGMTIREVMPARRSLEDAFIDLVGPENT